MIVFKLIKLKLFQTLIYFKHIISYTKGLKPIKLKELNLACRDNCLLHRDYLLLIKTKMNFLREPENKPF
jgi:hypothetical protein